MKLLVTGASGFVGSHLVELASKEGYEVHAAVRKSSDISSIKPYVYKFHDIDLAPDKLSSFFETERYDYVIHAAAMTKAKSESHIMAANVALTERLLGAAFGCSVPPQRFVFVSSLAAIGPVGYNDEDITDDADYRPVTLYGRSKRAAEEMIKQKFTDKPISIIRPTAVYGPREKDLFILFDTMNKGLDAYIGRAPQKLSFVYVKDLIQVLLNACTAPQPVSASFNITDGHVYSRYAMAEIFKQTFTKKLVRLHVPYALVKRAAQLSAWIFRNSTKTPVIYPERLGELTAQNWSCDISKAKHILHYQPKYDLAEGLRESLLWYKDNKWF
ncbi:NAD-dependent epimerase/dehydratase family protein [Sphingobacterium paludis]|uniref:Nucleoside-diphosphate-sugar epimerase n=1 Tax=Sphingobacterium paludis TaxID=1476465 RepID=A0A4R7CT07_9SPHI|nr:NAD(P)-dependent oxidoreductase [Sphingobacterium paludis]TDS09726.1 nucleoside-diphosphate-sugar epimerase [Sphingobacterium paludis]